MNGFMLEYIDQTKNEPTSAWMNRYVKGFMHESFDLSKEEITTARTN
jgi:hypothetical protein